MNLLGGLIDIQNVDVSSTATSDAVRATTGGTATVTGVSVAGHALRIENGAGNPAGFSLSERRGRDREKREREKKNGGPSWEPAVFRAREVLRVLRV